MEILQIMKPMAGKASEIHHPWLDKLLQCGWPGGNLVNRETHILPMGRPPSPGFHNFGFHNSSGGKCQNYVTQPPEFHSCRRQTPPPLAYAGILHKDDVEPSR